MLTERIHQLKISATRVALSLIKACGLGAIWRRPHMFYYLLASEDAGCIRGQTINIDGGIDNIVSAARLTIESARNEM